MKKELLSDLVLDFASPIPVYEQLKRILQYAIARGTLVEGEDLPSIRELATFLTINPNTVARTYREMMQTGVIGGRAGKGFWVNKLTQNQENRNEILLQEFLKFVEKAVAMGFNTQAIKSVIDGFFQEGMNP